MLVAVSRSALLSRATPHARRALGSLAPWVPTPDAAADVALDLFASWRGQGKRGGVLVDIGCGDGRVVEAAAARGLRCIGVELDPELVDAARARLLELPAEARALADIVHGDVQSHTEVLGRANFVYAYLTENAMLSLTPLLTTHVRPGALLVSCDYPLAPHHDHHWHHARTQPFLDLRFLLYARRDAAGRAPE